MSTLSPTLPMCVIYESLPGHRGRSYRFDVQNLLKVLLLTRPRDFRMLPSRTPHFSCVRKRTLSWRYCGDTYPRQLNPLTILAIRPSPQERALRFSPESLRIPSHVPGRSALGRCKCHSCEFITVNKSTFVHQCVDFIY